MKSVYIFKSNDGEFEIIVILDIKETDDAIRDAEAYSKLEDLQGKLNNIKEEFYPDDVLEYEKNKKYILENICYIIEKYLYMRCCHF